MPKEQDENAYGPTSYWPRSADLDRKTRALLDEQYRARPRYPHYYDQGRASEKARENDRERDALVAALSREELRAIGRKADGTFLPGHAPPKAEAERRGGWYGLVPPEVATKQLAWERRQAVLRARSLGMTYAEIAERMGCSRNRAQQLDYLAQRTKKSPVEHWLMRGPGELQLAIREIAERYRAGKGRGMR